MNAERFLDTNVLVCAFDRASAKADVAETLLEEGGVVSVQVLNELTNVARRKLGFSFPEIREVLDVIRRLCSVVPITLEAHELGLDLAERYQLGIYDGLVVASAQLAGCSTLCTEDLQNGQRLGVVTVRNPFAATA
jgi:predicted nucleic acid-binding protein